MLQYIEKMLPRPSHNKSCYDDTFTKLSKVIVDLVENPHSVAKGDDLQAFLSHGHLAAV